MIGQGSPTPSRSPFAWLATRGSRLHPAAAPGLRAFQRLHPECAVQGPRASCARDLRAAVVVVLFACGAGGLRGAGRGRRIDHAPAHRLGRRGRTPMARVDRIDRRHAGRSPAAGHRSRRARQHLARRFDGLDSPAQRTGLRRSRRADHVRPGRESHRAALADRAGNGDQAIRHRAEATRKPIVYQPD